MILNCLKTRLIETFSLFTDGCFGCSRSVFEENFLLGCFFCPQDAPKTDVAHAGIDHLWLARRGPVTQAVVGSAQVRTTLDDLAWNADLWLPRVVALLSRS